MPPDRLPEPGPGDVAHPLNKYPVKVSSSDCPGFLIQQPQVLEALHAHRWWDKGQLAQHVGDQPATPWLNLYVDAVTSAVAELDEERERKREEARREAEAGRG